MDNPILSIITPTHQSIKYIDDTAKSIFKLNLRYEWIIIDNCSTDGTQEFLSQLAAKHADITVILNKVDNQDPHISLSQGLVQAEGKYVLFVDSDDTIIAESIHVALKKLEENKNIHAVISKVEYMTGSGKIYKSKKIPFVKYDALISGTQLGWLLFFSPTYPIRQGSIIFRRKIFKHTGDIFDIDLVLEATKYTDFWLSDFTGLNYRNVAGSWSSRNFFTDYYWIGLSKRFFGKKNVLCRWIFNIYKMSLGLVKSFYRIFIPYRI